MAQSKISNPQSSEMTDMSNNSIFSETMGNPTNPEVHPIAEQSEAAQSKSTSPTAKQRKSGLEDYRTAFFPPIKLGKDNKHQVAIRNFSCQGEQSQARLSYAECSREWRNAMRRLTVSSASHDSSAGPVIASATLSSTSSMSISTATLPTMKAGSL